VSVAHADFMNKVLGQHPAEPRFLTTINVLRPAEGLALNFWQAVRFGLNAVAGEEENLVTRALGAIPSSIHLHGGGYLNSLWPVNGFKLGIAAGLKRVVGCPLVATGIGFTPQKTVPADDDLAAFEEAISLFDLFEVRDRPSFEFIERYLGPRAQVVDGLDDTYLVPFRRRDGRPRTLSLSCFRPENMLKFLRSLPEGYFGNFERIQFWAATPGDRASRDKLSELFPKLETLDLLRFISSSALPIGPGDVLFTDRFHPHLLAARQGATGAFRGDDEQYYDVKHGSVLALGSPFVPFKDFDTVASLDMPPAAIVERESELVDRKAAIAARVAQALRG
jgi:hypothetical protein